jgi:hypothetical protein
MIVLLALLAAAQVPPRPAPPPRSALAHEAAMGTRCSFCHSTKGWRPVTFDHSKTGFPLEGRHVSASCRGCHVAGQDFKAPVPASCSACHKDVHTGEFGTRCSSCHDARDWSSRFDAHAHERTNFPLTGRHAAIPCEECHLEQRDRRFTRAALDCVACHQKDYARTAMTSIDHAKAGFSTDCKSCHFSSRFKGAYFAAHSQCFQIDTAPHAGIACLRCHTTFTGAPAIGTCSGDNFSCIQCHACSTVGPLHASVGGFQCKDRKCYECHSFTSGSGTRSFRTKGVR